MATFRTFWEKISEIIVFSLNPSRDLNPRFKQMIVPLMLLSNCHHLSPSLIPGSPHTEVGPVTIIDSLPDGRVQDSSHMKCGRQTRKLIEFSKEHDEKFNSYLATSKSEFPFQPSPELCSVCSPNIESISMRSWFLINWPHFYSISFSDVAICDLADRTGFHRIGNPDYFRKRNWCWVGLIGDLRLRFLIFEREHSASSLFPDQSIANSFFTQPWRAVSFFRSPFFGLW
jgi:hypothetical protein